MKINEVIKKVDLSKRAIKFYEEKGFLNVERDANGYRNFSKEDILILKQISVYRKLNISLQDIKNILKDENKLNDILKQKRNELVTSQEELEALEKYIKDKDINDLNASVDYDTIAESIKNAVPGFYGYSFLNHFLPYLQLKIESNEQQKAYKAIIDFWDNTTIKIPLPLHFNMWIMYKLNHKDLIKQNTERIDSYIKMYLNPTPKEYDKFKKQIAHGVKVKNSFLYKYSLVGVAQRKLMKELQNKGYNDIFIPNMIKLSPKYKEFHDALEKLNDRICSELNLYYDNNYNLIQKTK